jgi:hypothetical protein
MRGNGHVKTPAIDWKSRPKRKKAALLRVRPSRKLEADLFSFVVGHGTTHHRRTSDDAELRGIWSG